MDLVNISGEWTWVDVAVHGAYVATMSNSVRGSVVYAVREVGKNYPDFKNATIFSDEAERQGKAMNAVKHLEGDPPGTQFEVVKITIEPLEEGLSESSVKKKTSELTEWITSLKKK